MFRPSVVRLSTQLLLAEGALQGWLDSTGTWKVPLAAAGAALAAHADPRCVLSSMHIKRHPLPRLVQHCARAFGEQQDDVVVLQPSKVRASFKKGMHVTCLQIARHCALQLLRAQPRWAWPAFEAEWTALLPAVRCSSSRNH